MAVGSLNSDWIQYPGRGHRPATHRELARVDNNARRQCDSTHASRRDTGHLQGTASSCRPLRRRRCTTLGQRRSNTQPVIGSVHSMVALHATV